MTTLLQTPRPLGGFRVAAADPPWRYRGYASEGVPQRAAVQHYETMSLEDLCELPVHDMMARDAVLHMWVLNSHLDQGLTLGAAWGFVFKTVGFVWDKGRMSLGKWTRQESEICLLFTCGRPSRRATATGVRQVIRAKPREHSRKPDEFYDRVEALSAGGYLDLFGRQQRPGWTVFGAQADRFTAPESETAQTGGPVCAVP